MKRPTHTEVPPAFRPLTAPDGEAQVPPSPTEERTARGFEDARAEQRASADVRLREIDQRFAGAVARFREMQEQHRDLTAALQARHERRNEIRRRLQAIETRRAEIRRTEPVEWRRAAAEGELVEEERALRADLEALEHAHADLAARSQPLGTLLDRCERFLRDEAAIGTRLERLTRLRMVQEAA